MLRASPGSHQRTEPVMQHWVFLGNTLNRLVCTHAVSAFTRLWHCVLPCSYSCAHPLHLILGPCNHVAFHHTACCEIPVFLSHPHFFCTISTLTKLLSPLPVISYSLLCYSFASFRALVNIELSFTQYEIITTAIRSGLPFSGDSREKPLPHQGVRHSCGGYIVAILPSCV